MSVLKSYYHNLGLGTNYVFLHVGWVQNQNLFSVVFLLVSTRATWDSGIKILYDIPQGLSSDFVPYLFPRPNSRRNSVHLLS